MGSGEEICSEMAPLLRIVGIVVWAIKVVVPIILIVMGMIDLAKAVAEKDEGKIKSAQTLLVRRAITAVLVFLVVTFVGLIMGLIGAKDYEECMTCINHPFRCKAIEDVNSGN